MFNTDFASCTCVINSLIISTMKNIKILEKAFKEGKTPKGIVYCFLSSVRRRRSVSVISVPNARTGQSGWTMLCFLTFWLMESASGSFLCVW